VPGDAVHLCVGDVTPADVGIESGSLQADNSVLTGESLPVELGAGGVAYAGSVITRGEATGTVAATGSRTFFGRTGATSWTRLQTSCRRHRPSPLTATSTTAPDRYGLSAIWAESGRVLAVQNDAQNVRTPDRATRLVEGGGATKKIGRGLGRVCLDRRTVASQ